MVTSFFLTNKDNFLRQFHFFLDAIHEKHNFKYLQNPTVKVCKIWCNDVYMYILYCDIFSGNSSTVFLLFRFLIPGRYLRASHLLNMIISKQDIHICYLFHIYLTITLKCIEPKYSLPTRSFRN